MQPSDKIEQPLIELRSSDRRARIGVEQSRAHACRRGIWCGSQIDIDDGFVGIPAKEQRHLPRILRSRLLDQTVKIGRRSARGRRRKLRLRAWEMMNLLRKKMRKTGTAKHATEGGTDKARTFVEQLPDPDRLSCHTSEETRVEKKGVRQ